MAVRLSTSFSGFLQRLRAAAHRFAANPRVFLRRQYRTRIRQWLIPAPRETVISVVTGGASFEFDFDYAPVIKEMWHGAYETEIVDLMERLLAPGDVFFDVGANVGYLSAVALGLVGERGQVHSFEPSPPHYRRLQRLQALNPNREFFLNECALGNAEGELVLKISSGTNIGWNTVVPGFMWNDPDRVDVVVPVRRLDAYIDERGITAVDLIKVDVEGYELPVLEGLSAILDAGMRPTIICEVNPAAYPRLGRPQRDLWNYMEGRGYRVADVLDLRAYEPKAEITMLSNVVFLPA